MKKEIERILEDRYVVNAFERAVEIIKDSLVGTQAQLDLQIQQSSINRLHDEIEDLSHEDFEPCPFCGSKDVDIDIVYTEDIGPNTKETFFVRCGECRAWGPTSHSKNCKDAIKKWNKRAS